MRRDELFLRDIVEAAQHIADDMRGLDRLGFLANRTVRDAVVRNVTVVGEACARMSPELRERHPDIPWADIVAFRNILVRAYFGIDWEIVWYAASRQAPELAEQMERVVREEFTSED